MIKIDSNKNLIVTDDDLFIGYTGDNLNVTKEILIENETDISLIYRMYLKFDDGTCNFFLLDKAETDNGTKLIWKITSDQIYKDGIVKVQIKASNSSGEVFHTNSINMLVQSSIEFCDSFAEKKVSEYLQHEEHLNEIVRKGQEIYDYFSQFEFDSEPTVDSNKLISSGAVYTAFSELDKIKISTVNGIAPDENGNVDLIVKANAIDLSAHLKKGEYYFTIYPTADPQVTGLPETIYGLWLMSIWENDGEKFQRLTAPTGKTYYRIFKGDGWTPFVNDNLVTMNDLCDYVKTVNGILPDENGNVDLIKKAEAIDLSAHLKIGEYYFTIYPTADPQVTGLPETIYGLWLMSIWENDGEKFQRLTAPTGKTYYRIFKGDGWTPFVNDNLVTMNDLCDYVKTVNGIAPDEDGNVEVIVRAHYSTSLADCNDQGKLYYYYSGISDLGPAGDYIGFVKKLNDGWLFISSGEGQVKANYRILEDGTQMLIGSTYDYNDLSNKPKLNDVELTGEMTLSELGIYGESEVDEIIANQTISGSGTLNITSQSIIDANVISSATYYYVKQREIVTLFCSIKFNEGSCNYAGFNGLPFNYNNKAGQLRIYAASSNSEMFRAAVSGSMLYISSSTTARTQDEELNFSITYLV